MFPLKDNLRYSVFPWATVTIVAINILVYIFEMSLTSMGEMNSVIHGWLLSRNELIDAVVSGNAGAILHCIGALLAPMWLHGGFEHIFGNMCFFFTFAPAVEARMGTKRFAVFYLLAGIIASLVQAATDATGYGVGLGASGAIGGVMGAYIVLFPRAEVEGWVPISPLPLPFVSSAFLFLLDFMLMQVISIYMTMVSPSFAASATVGFWAHAGGMSFGLIVATCMCLCTRFYKKPPPERTVVVPRRPPERSRYLFELALDVPVAVVRFIANLVKTCIVGLVRLALFGLRFGFGYVARFFVYVAVKLHVDGFFRRQAARLSGWAKATTRFGKRLASPIYRLVARKRKAAAATVDENEILSDSDDVSK